MRCHNREVLSRCGILHRDISENNILVMREGEDPPSVRGLLVDFDNALDTTIGPLARHDRTGTHPFMSINDLEDSHVRRMALDDWGSLLYLICWLGTFSTDGSQKREGEVLPIKYWVEGGYKNIVNLSAVTRAPGMALSSGFWTTSSLRLT
ncbi:hypothetical protein EV182_000303 [Spiromyces aspiralis]|uniref:Uncharacterized protein n=1 Tax=Spiromyces aspiralis TaxID=68401 RepID=A0ACC1HUK9_9FUNG|nr:hypothetical protein EV182_000303 [Spiromyces aspiralis]